VSAFKTAATVPSLSEAQAKELCRMFSTGSTWPFMQGTNPTRDALVRKDMVEPTGAERPMQDGNAYPVYRLKVTTAVAALAFHFKTAADRAQAPAAWIKVMAA
jgi:hypothetical protein